MRLIKPHLLYAILIWGSFCSTYKHRLRALRNSAVRAIDGFHRQQYISPAYSKLGILKLDDLHKSEIANFMFSYSNAPTILYPSLCNPFSFNLPMFIHILLGIATPI